MSIAAGIAIAFIWLSVPASIYVLVKNRYEFNPIALLIAAVIATGMVVSGGH